VDKVPMGTWSKVAGLKRSDGKDIHIVFQLRDSATAAATGGAGTGGSEWCTPARVTA